MTLRATIIAAGLVVGATFSALPANAATLNWVLSGVTFDDGGAASGTFSTDSTSGNIIAFDIVTTGGTTLGGAVYDSTSVNTFSSNGIYSSNSFILTNFDTFTYINLEFVDALTGTGTDQLIFTVGTTVGSYECNLCATFRGIISGEAISAEDGAATPLPAALPLFATGLGVMGLLGRRRKKKALATI